MTGYRVELTCLVMSTPPTSVASRIEKSIQPVLPGLRTVNDSLSRGIGVVTPDADATVTLYTPGATRFEMGIGVCAGTVAVTLLKTWRNVSYPIDTVAAPTVTLRGSRKK